MVRKSRRVKEREGGREDKGREKRGGRTERRREKGRK